MTYIVYIVLGYLAAALIAATMEMWWFTTSLPIHLTKWLRRWGWKRNTPGFWPDDETYEFWLRHEWEEWVTLKDDHEIPSIVREGVSCPGCLSLHCSYIAASIVNLVLPHGGGFFFTLVQSLLFIIGGALMLPYPAVLSLELLKLVRRASSKKPY